MRRIEGIVIHRCESGRTGEEVKAAELAHGFGYHLLVMRGGGVARMYDDSESPWHALHWSPFTIAIAVFGDFVAADKSRNHTPTDAQLATCVGLCAELVEKYTTPRGIPWIAGHTELQGAARDPLKVCPGERFPMTWLRAKVGQRMSTLKAFGAQPVALLPPKNLPRVGASV